MVGWPQRTATSDSSRLWGLSPTPFRAQYRGPVWPVPSDLPTEIPRLAAHWVADGHSRSGETLPAVPAIILDTVFLILTALGRYPSVRPLIAHDFSEFMPISTIRISKVVFYARHVLQKHYLSNEELLQVYR